MKILATIAERAAAEGLAFLLIGGNAVNAYGFERGTHDLDWLVCETDRRAWDNLITGLGYRAHQIARVFHMYNPLPESGMPPVDWMLVDASTFSKLVASPRSCVLEKAPVSVPALPHLIALKLHALRSGSEHRHARDFLDVVELVQINKVNLATPAYQEILQRYADEATRQKLVRTIPRAFGSEPSDL